MSQRHRRFSIVASILRFFYFFNFVITIYKFTCDIVTAIEKPNKYKGFGVTGRIKKSVSNLFQPVTERDFHMKKSRLCFIGCLVGVLLLSALAKHQATTGEYMGDIAAWVMMISLMILLPAGLVYRFKEKANAYSEEEWARKCDEEERKVLAAMEEMQLLKDDRTIVSTAIVNSTTIGTQKSSAASSIARGAVGGALFGVVGAVAGAVTPKKTLTTKTKDVTFSVRYASGRCELETVKFGSKRYKELAKYIA